MYQGLMETLAELVSKYFEKEGDSYPSNWAGWDAFHDHARELGFKRLGSGYFSAAYSHPDIPGKVLKVGFKKEDSAAAYIGFCRLMAGTKGLPVVHYVERFERCYIVVLDHLKPFHRNYEGDLNSDYFSVIYRAVEWGEDIVNDFDFSKYALSEAHAESLYQKALQYRDTGLKIHQFFNGIADFDCHSGNVMVDEHGELVVTDPVSFTKGIKCWDAMDPTIAASERERIHAERCKQRHERKLNKPVVRKEFRKAKQKRERKRKIDIAHRNHWDNQARGMAQAGIIDKAAWVMHGWVTLRKMAEQVRQADRVALVDGGWLAIDKVHDAQLDQIAKRPPNWGFTFRARWSLVLRD